MSVRDVQESGQAFPGEFGCWSIRSSWDNQRRKDGAWCPTFQGPGLFFPPILEPVLPLPNFSFSSTPILEVGSKGLLSDNSLYC